jgi:hypothetical protein
MATAPVPDYRKPSYADAVAIVTAKIGPRPERVPSTLQTTYLSTSKAKAIDHFHRVLTADTAARVWDRKVSAVMRGELI